MAGTQTRASVCAAASTCSCEGEVPGAGRPSGREKSIFERGTGEECDERLMRDKGEGYRGHMLVVRIYIPLTSF